MRPGSDQHVSFHPWNWVKSMAPSYRQEGVNAAPSKAAGWSASSWGEWAEARETDYKDVMDKNGTGMAKLTAAIVSESQTTAVREGPEFLISDFLASLRAGIREKHPN